MIERLRLLERSGSSWTSSRAPTSPPSRPARKAADNDRAWRDAARAAARYGALLERSAEGGALNLRAFVELSRMARLDLALEREVGGTSA